MMTSAGILVLFIVIPSETCTWIPTVEQQDFCSAQYGKLVNNENFYAKPTYSRVRYMLARSSSLEIFLTTYQFISFEIIYVSFSRTVVSVNQFDAVNYEIKFREF